MRNPYSRVKFSSMFNVIKSAALLLVVLNITGRGRQTSSFASAEVVHGNVNPSNFDPTQEFLLAFPPHAHIVRKLDAESQADEATSLLKSGETVITSRTGDRCWAHFLLEDFAMLFRAVRELDGKPFVLWLRPTFVRSNTVNFTMDRNMSGPYEELIAMVGPRAIIFEHFLPHKLAFYTTQAKQITSVVPLTFDVKTHSLWNSDKVFLSRTASHGFTLLYVLPPCHFCYSPGISA
jgi:hypothetical protein